eukprot:53772_1
MYNNQVRYTTQTHTVSSASCPTMLFLVLFAMCSVPYTCAAQTSTCTDIHGGDWTLVRHAYNAWHPATDNLAGTDVYGTYDNDPQSTSNWSISYSGALEDDGSSVFMFSNGDCSEFLITSSDPFISQNNPYLARIIASHYDTNYNVIWSYTSSPWLSWQNTSVVTLLYGEASNTNHLDRFNVDGADLSVNVWIRNDKYFAAPTSFEGTWQKASDYCESHDTHLASIHSYKDLQMALLECASVNDKCWIGLNDITTEGMWQWSDNTITDYGFLNDNFSNPTTGVLPWGSGQPNNLHSDQDCVGLDHGILGDFNCSDTWLRPLCNQVDPFCDRGVIKQDTCCAFSCGTCGGTGCSDRPGGAEKCCQTPIRDSNETCDHSVAPCVISQSRNPTADPSSSPSNHPTAVPSEAPSNAPTQPPSAAPSVSPTACYERSGLIDIQAEQIVNDKISSLQFKHRVTDATHTVYSEREAQYLNAKLLFANNDKQQMHCNISGACVGSTMIFTNNTYCNVLCDAFLSCHGATIDVTECTYTDIICNGTYSCDSMEIVARANHSGSDYGLNIRCGVASSCDHMTIDIIGNVHSEVTCLGLNACDGLVVNVEADHYKNNILQMYSFSNNVTYANGFGYEEEDGTKTYIQCNERNQWIEYNASDDEAQLQSLIINEYIGNRFPCDGVIVECFSDDNANATSACNMKFAVDTKAFDAAAQNASTDCPWVSISEIMVVSCDGYCATSPTRDPTPAPTIAPTLPTHGPTYNPTSVPTIDPTHDPTTDPTKDPSNAPTSSPSNAPSFSPTNNPSIAPTSPPTASPSVAPSNAPSFSPSSAPTRSPTTSPSNAPSKPPSAAPTRVPTLDVDDIYDTKIAIEYMIHNLSVDNKQLIVDDTRSVVGAMERMIESGYFDENNNLFYTDIWLVIQEINGVNVEEQEQEISTNAAGDDGKALTVYDLDILNQEHRPMILSSNIECDGLDAQIIIKRSHTSSFAEHVEEWFQTYFDNNTDIYFAVFTDAEDLTEALKYPPAEEEATDSTALALSIVIVSIGAVISVAAFAFNKASSTKGDGSSFMVPLLVSLNIYDFISDINLSISIFKNERIKYSVDNIVLWLGVLSVVFIVFPFSSNILYAMRITSQSAIKQSPSARAWLTKHLAMFIVLCIACAGTYPVLLLCSSRIFALDFFNMGLLSIDLHELSKIKIRSTIFMENCPQLLIQIVYSIVISDVADATYLAFVASSLSIVSSMVVYQAHKDQEAQVIITKYYIRFANSKERSVGIGYQRNIKQHKGLKAKLAERICTVINIPNKSIEIGFVTPHANGCVIHVQHSIFEENLERVKNRLYKGAMHQGFHVQITPELYVRNLYELHRAQITDVLKAHFEIDDNDFTATYFERYEDADVKVRRKGDNEGQMTRDTDNQIAEQITKQATSTVAVGVSGDELEMVPLKSPMTPQFQFDPDSADLRNIINTMQSQMEMLQNFLSANTPGMDKMRSASDDIQQAILNEMQN